MGNIFDAIANRDRNLSAVTATVTDGPAVGEKVLISDGQIVWMTDQASVLPGHLEEISAAASGTILTDGKNRIFCERIGSEKMLVICGAGHVSMPIIKIGKMLGFHVTVIDDRPKFADDARRARADQVICDRFDAALETIPGGPDTYFVIVTRGHRYDADCLKAILKKNNSMPCSGSPEDAWTAKHSKGYAYLGMMGSKRRVAIVKQDLKEDGFPADAVDHIYTPIGLNIGAETPEEIAISVMAEIIQVKNEEKASDTYSRELLTWLSGEREEKRQMVLATIISRRGSAPREVGTKMLILEDGQTVETIGGGCVESDVIGKARRMMRGEARDRYQRISVDMTEDQASEAGMVCGGTVEIFMERVIWNEGK